MIKKIGDIFCSVSILHYLCNRFLGSTSPSSCHTRRMMKRNRTNSRIICNKRI